MDLPYIDSSLLVKLYYPEELSDKVTDLIKKIGKAIPFTSLHELEIKNAVSLKVFRKELDTSKRDLFLSTIDHDLSAGVLKRTRIDWGAVYSKALELSINTTGIIGARTLDILHIASAAAGGFSTFYTHDARQGNAAERAGLTVQYL